MTQTTPDQLVALDDWSDLRDFLPLPEIDLDKLYAYRTERLRNE